METDEMNFEILKGAARALKNGGKFIFTTDLMTFRDRNSAIFEDDAGNKKELRSDERYYVPSEITWLLNSLGVTQIDIYGAKLGAYSRNDKLTPEDFEMLVVAVK